MHGQQFRFLCHDCKHTELLNDHQTENISGQLPYSGLDESQIQDILNAEKAWQAEQRGITSIDNMEGHDFEYWCADILKRSGFDNVEVTPGSGDQGS